MPDLIDDRLKTGGAFSALPQGQPDFADRLRGRVLSGYEVGDLLGAGGMGYVVRAHRAEGDFDRDAAIKVVEASHPSSEFAQRFRQEVQILAQLNHANIAQLYDAGETDAGWPYLVMEYIDGAPVDTYVAEQNLTTRTKLELLIQVADALQFAHGPLVVHRDLKPSNVLVDSNGKPKLLDFGIAMLLRDSGEELTRGNAMTPQYASPEQLLGKPISVATDIYQFGLLIADLLCGGLPWANASLPEAIQRAAEGRDLQLTAGQRAELPRELLLIIEQCLRADPADRYSNMGALKNDLVAYLAGYPVSAAGQSRRYRVGKFVRRNWKTVAGATGAVLGLVAATIITAWQMVEANQQRDIAIYQQQRVQASSEFYSLLLEVMGEGSFTSVDLLDRGRQLLRDQFGSGQPFMGSVLFDVSRRYASLGEQDQETELLAEAETIARDHQDDDLLAAVLCSMARSNLVRDRELATAQRLEGMALFGGLEKPSLEVGMACLRAQADYEIKAGDYETALQTLLAADGMLDAHPAPANGTRAMIWNSIASVYFYSRQTQQAIEYLDKVLSLLEASGRAGTLRYQQIAANRAVTLQTRGQTRQALAAFDTLGQNVHSSGMSQRGQAVFHTQYADLLVRVGRSDEAETAYRRGLNMARAGGNGRIMSAIRIGLVKVHVARQELVQAQEELANARAFVSQGEPRPLAISTRHFAATLERLNGDPQAAAQAIDVLLDELGYPEIQRGPGLLATLTEGATAHSVVGNHPRAMALADGLVERVAVSMPSLEGNIDLGLAQWARAQVYDAAGDADIARAALGVALPQLLDVLGAAHPTVRDAQLLNKRLSAI
ncbi:MAG: protein kinase [Pseudomonadota bacterium]